MPYLNISPIVISVASTEGETIEDFIKKRIEDVATVGKTFWHIHSQNEEVPIYIHRFCSIGIPKHELSSILYCYFILGSEHKIKPTTHGFEVATRYSSNLIDWNPLPPELNDVRGRSIKPGAYALVFDQIIKPEHEYLDLWDYADFFKNEPVKITKSHTTICAKKSDGVQTFATMKLNDRKIIARGRLVSPYCVYLDK
jgi:hypothetical protein